MKFIQFLKSRTFFIQVGLAIVGLLLFVFLLQWWLGFTTNHDQKIAVPDIKGMTLELVEQELSNGELFEIYKQQAKLKQMLKELLGQKNEKEGKGNGGDIVKKMEDLEKEMLEKGFSSEVIITTSLSSPHENKKAT